MKRIDRTCLSWWLPKIEAAGLPVPRTKLLRMPEVAQKDVWASFDGQQGTGAIGEFIAELRAAAAEIGFPCFLRTGQTSGKHRWCESCYVPSADAIGAHLSAIVEYSEMAGFIGLDWTVWAIRELLPTMPFGICRRYGAMPICREFRFFVEDGRVLCWHPYWPLQVLVDGGADEALDYEGLCRMDALEELSALANRAGATAGGFWSVDLLETERGWFLVDMAEGQKSFHWEGCPNSRRSG